MSTEGFMRSVLRRLENIDPYDVTPEELEAVVNCARAALAKTAPPANERIKPLNTDMNAARWASEFVKLHGGDENLMCVWFANTLMCGWDNHYWTTPEYKASIDRALGQLAPPAEGEVAELVAALGVIAVDAEVADKIWEMQILDRAAALLQQHLQPVPVSERPWESRPGWLNSENECWWCPPAGPKYWTMANPQMVYGGWVLPAHAMPLPEMTP